MNGSHYIINVPRFFTPLVITLALFLTSCVLHEIMHVSTQDGAFKTERHQCKICKSLAVSNINVEKNVIYTPVIVDLTEYTIDDLLQVISSRPRGPPKT